MSPQLNDLAALSAVITDRDRSVFSSAMAAVDDRFAELFGGATVLVTGGGGFIGGQAIRVVLRHRPKRLVVADVNENALAELVRDLRVEGSIPAETRFEPRLLDITGPLVRPMADLDGPFDVAMAFAAAKHVRSERDPISALHMVNVNINGTRRVADAVMSQNPECKLFVVSTDKAADPSSMMGASKRIMEMQVLGAHPAATTTRFANVAFSTGSLLESWLIRLERGQLLSVPSDTRRFFVSPAESGELCALATAAPPGSIAIPAKGAVTSLDLLDALRRLIDFRGERLVVVESLEEAAAAHRAPGLRVALMTPRDTAGEKAVEIFVGRDEQATGWLTGVDVVRSTSDLEATGEFCGWVEESLAAGSVPSLDAIADRLAKALPTFKHVRSELGLDDRV